MKTCDEKLEMKERARVFFSSVALHVSHFSFSGPWAPASVPL